MPKQKEKVDLSKALKDLESLVSWFDDQEEVDVEKGLEKVKEGAKLIQESKTRLKEIENEFEEVKENISKEE